VCYGTLFTRRDKGIRAISSRVRPGDPLPASDAYILEYSGWYPLAERFRHLPGKKVFWYHGVTPPETWGTRTDLDALERSVYGCELSRYADLVVADSPFGARELWSHQGGLQDRTRVIGLSVSTRSLQSPALDQEALALRGQLGLGDRRVVLYVGRLAGNKRIDLLISALHLLRERLPDTMLLVVGDDRSSPAYGEYAAQLRAQVHSLGLDDRVLMVGKVPRIEPYYRLAECLVLPSDHEGFGVPLVEAMAAGTLAIASDIAAMPYVMGAEAGEPAGLLFKAGSAESLAEQLSALYEDPERAAIFRDRGRKRAALFSPEVFAADTLDMIQSLLAGGARPDTEGEPADPWRLRADVALREYRARSRVPAIGRLIEWVRENMTTHVKEAYLDRIVERQVLYNLSTLERIERLETVAAEQAALIEALKTLLRAEVAGEDLPPGSRVPCSESAQRPSEKRTYEE